MALVFAVVNQKGGVGKTTTAVNVAAWVAVGGRRVLLVDLDPQGNATSGVGIDKNAIGHEGNSIQASTYDVIINDYPMADAITPTDTANLDVLPANLDLAGAELELMPRMSREMCLKLAIDTVRDRYDFIFIDAPPSLGLLTINALVAADLTIIPIQCEYYALEGVSQLMKTFNLVKRNLNPELEVGLVVMTMYDNRIRLAQQVVEEVRNAFREKVAHTIIPRNVRLSEAPSHGKPIPIYDPRSRGAVAYKQIAQEVIAIGQKRTG